jgi:hypothetical protein
MFEEEKGIVGKEGEGEVRVPQGSNVGFCVMFEQMVGPLWKGKGGNLASNSSCHLLWANRPQVPQHRGHKQFEQNKNKK